jgi:hypothetical protein
VSSRTRALRFVASACIPIEMLRRKRRHVSARILQTTLQDMDQSSTARHYRQAKQNSQNFSTIATGTELRQHAPKAPGHYSRAGEPQIRSRTEVPLGMTVIGSARDITSHPDQLHETAPP